MQEKEFAPCSNQRKTEDLEDEFAEIFLNGRKLHFCGRKRTLVGRKHLKVGRKIHKVGRKRHLIGRKTQSAKK